MNIIKINTFESLEDLPGPKLYHNLNETQLLHYNEPSLGYFIAESPNVIERALRNNYEPVSFLVQEKELATLIPLIEQYHLSTTPIYTTEEKLFKEIIGAPMTRGILCAMKRKEKLTLDELCKDTKRLVVLEDVVNPTNLGAITRCAAALNIDGLLLTKGCCDPLQRRATRVSMGTIFQLPYTWIDDISLLKNYGYKTVAMALKENSLTIDHPQLKQEPKLAILLGSEGPGLKEETIINADYTVMIPMEHGVDSLNVASAAAIAIWELSKTSS
ncbi:MAG: RNA methyltransferase [Erysipelotrichaceae bacterium]|nr:RNA methyltransferase [Erysipelotrichaceae bacterium]